MSFDHFDPICMVGSIYRLPSAQRLQGEHHLPKHVRRIQRALLIHPEGTHVPGTKTAVFLEVGWREDLPEIMGVMMLIEVDWSLTTVEFGRFLPLCPWTKRERTSGGQLPAFNWIFWIPGDSECCFCVFKSAASNGYGCQVACPWSLECRTSTVWYWPPWHWTWPGLHMRKTPGYGKICFWRRNPSPVHAVHISYTLIWLLWSQICSTFRFLRSCFLYQGDGGMNMVLLP